MKKYFRTKYHSIISKRNFIIEEYRKDMSTNEINKRWDKFSKYTLADKDYVKKSADNIIDLILPGDLVKCDVYNGVDVYRGVTVEVYKKLPNGNFSCAFGEILSNTIMEVYSYDKGEKGTKHKHYELVAKKTSISSKLDVVKSFE